MNKYALFSKYKYIIIIVMLLCIVYSAKAESSSRIHFSGGMAFHSFYLKSNEQTTLPNGLCSGLGGRAYFPIYKSFSVGLAGASLQRTYKSDGDNQKRSDLSFGFGGITFEYSFALNSKFTIGTGCLVGGGALKNWHTVNTLTSDTVVALHLKRSGLISSPFMTIEYNLTKAIKLNTVIEYFLFFSDSNKPIMGPKLQLGLLFIK
jgi:hypothetical protein